MSDDGYSKPSRLQKKFVIKVKFELKPKIKQNISNHYITFCLLESKDSKNSLIFSII